MGALHDGHLALVRQALERSDRAVVSIFVNPTQFAPHEDLDRYPRDEAGDLAKLAAVGAHLAYLPTVAEMYPEGASTWVEVEGLSRGLCADRRPHHFRGVATVVTMLLNQAQADLAVFGEKDYQQLQVIKRLAQRPRHPDRDRGRRHGARARRPRHVLAQPAPDARSSGARRATLYRVLARRPAASPTARRAAPSLDAAARSGSWTPASARSTMSSCATPRRWPRWRRSATGRPACWPPHSWATFA